MGDVLFRSANAMGAELLNLKNPSLAITVAGVLQEGKIKGKRQDEQLKISGLDGAVVVKKLDSTVLRPLRNCVSHIKKKQPKKLTIQKTTRNQTRWGSPGTTPSPKEKRSKSPPKTTITILKKQTNFKNSTLLRKKEIQFSLF